MSWFPSIDFPLQLLTPPSTVGAPLAGRMSDRMIMKWKKRRNGVWHPEDRLRATILSAVVLVPLSVLCSGLLIQYVPGPLGLVLTLICFFMNGIGVCPHWFVPSCLLTGYLRWMPYSARLHPTW